MTLCELELGNKAIIKELNGNKETKFQLQELGFTPGSEISLVSKGPFKDPLAFSIRGTIIALRKKEAMCVWV